MNFLSLHAVPTVRPASPAEVGEVIRQAAARGEAVYPLGGRTMLDLGLPPTKPGITIDITALDQIIDYPARDMTITVQAGITIAKLQDTLAKENQWLPIDVPVPERATLGGAIACNVSGPRRYGFGTFRDYVIGITVVNDRGQDVKAGGRVVKNVAGYDLCKLYTGSLGTLGVITQVTLKVRPKPDICVELPLRCPASALGNLVDSLHHSRTRPSYVVVMAQDRSLMSKDWWIVVGFEDRYESVCWQAQQLKEEVTSLASAGIESVGWYLTSARGFWGNTPPDAAAQVSFKASVLSHALADFCQIALPLVPELLAYAGGDVIIGRLPDGLRRGEAFETIRRLRQLAVQAQGNFILTRCPDEWKHELGVWGEPRADWELMRAIKRQLDPQNLFNPGRFVGGI